MANKRERQSAILEVVETRAVSSQEDLRKLLLHRGWDVTQATLSRDLRELRLARVPTPEGARYAVTDGTIEESRVALETLAIRRATPRLRAGVFAQLETDLEKMERPGSGKRWLALHDAFHNRIYAEADMPRLLEEIKRLRQSIYPYLLMYIDLRKDPEIPGHEHKTLLNVLKNRNPNEAARALAEHIRKGASTLVYEQLGSEDAFFDDENVS